MRYQICITQEVEHLYIDDMKKYIIVIFTLINLSAIGQTTYYVKNGGSDAAAGTSDETAWETITKVNTVWSAGTFVPGDVISFKAGDVFYGELIPAESGTSGNPITVTSYGTGDKPILTGFTEITSWTNEGSGIYSNVVSCESALEMVTIDGVQYGAGRFPNAPTLLTVDSHTYNSDTDIATITDADLNSDVQDWTGATVFHIRTHFAYDKQTITSHSGSTITYSSGYSPTDGWGYFIQNDIKCLTEFGDWYYDLSGTKFYMYFPDNNPDSYEVKIATKDKIIDLNSSITYITIDGLQIEGSNYVTIDCGNSQDNLTVSDCDIQFSGGFGILLNVCDNVTITNNTFDYTNINGIHVQWDSEYLTITNNIFNHTNQLLGAGSTGFYGTAIQAHYQGTNGGALIEYNKIYNTGYCGISFGGPNSICRYNYIDTFCTEKDDGAGIYYGIQDVAYDMEISHNVILNGVANIAGKGGTSCFAAGIYFDYNSIGTDKVIEYNTIANCDFGIFLSMNQNTEVTNNLVYNCTSNLNIQEFSVSPQVYNRSLTINNNIFCAKSSTQYPAKLQTYDDNFDLWGTIDYNYYAKPIASTTNIFACAIGNWTYVNHTLAEWTAYSTHDSNSNLSQVNVSSEDDIHFIYNETIDTKYYSLSSTMKDVTNTEYSGVISLSPFSGKVLLGVGTVTDVTEYQPPSGILIDADGNFMIDSDGNIMTTE